jgi:hypothetical protein
LKEGKLQETRVYNHHSLVPRDRPFERGLPLLWQHVTKRNPFSVWRKPAVQFLVSTSSDFGKQIKVSLRNAGGGNTNPQPSVIWTKEIKKEQRGSPKFVYQQIFYPGI